MNKHLKILEYNKVIELLSKYCVSGIGQEKVLNLIPVSKFDEIKTLQDYTEQARFCYEIVLASPFKRLIDVRSILKKLKIDGVLFISEVLAIFELALATKSMKSYVSVSPLIKEKANIIYNIADELIDLSSVEKIIASVITEEGEIRDNASNELYQLRQAIFHKQKALKNKANDLLNSSSFRAYLQEPILTMRNDRYVFPIKAQYRSNVDGIIHDQSSSGLTLYIEPMSLVHLQNDLNKLFHEEKLEITKILRTLSLNLKEYYDYFSYNFETLVDLDIIFAKAKYSIDLKSKRPLLSDKKILFLKEARHPLIPIDIVVSNDLKISDENRALIITGPNTGGKTVSLKTAGLLVLMHQIGLQLPVGEGSILGCFSNVFADIGDEQSIQQSLSTFSSHITNIRDIIEDIDEKSLILFDELGSGTDPSEGASLAVAILNYILEKKALVMATTHYNELKKYAYETPYVENASMEFDINSLKPTYKIIYGIAGQSNAYAISRRIGLNNIIISAAKSYNINNTLESEHLLKKLEEEKTVLLQEKQLYEIKLEEYKEKITAFEIEKETLELQKNKIINSAKKEAQKIVDKAKKDMEEAIQEIKDLQKESTFSSIVKAQAIKANVSNNSKFIISEEAKNKKLPIPKDKLKEGMSVYIATLDDNGVITKYQKGSNEAYIEVGLMKMNVPIKQLFYPQKNKMPPQRIESKPRKNSVKTDKTKLIATSIDLRGLLVDDALILLDKYIDDAYLSSLNEISIIHGKGTGALRTAVTDYLKKHRYVTSYRFGSYHEGGNGNTIVTLR